MKPPRSPDRPAPTASARPLPTGRDRGEPVDDIDRGLGELVDDDRRSRALRERRDADLRRAIEEDTATLRGWLRDAGEHGRNLLVEHDGGRVAGRVVGLGGDHVLLERRGMTGLTVLRLDAIVTVLEEGAPTPVRGRRDRALGPTLRDVLVEAFDRRCEVRAHLRGRREVLAGTPTAVGEDVATFGGPGRGRTLVPLERILRLDLES